MFFSGGDVCECYYDEAHGHWTDPSEGCVQCFPGWRMPDCKKCAASMYNILNFDPFIEQIIIIGVLAQ